MCAVPTAGPLQCSGSMYEKWQRNFARLVTHLTFEKRREKKRTTIRMNRRKSFVYAFQSVLTAIKTVLEERKEKMIVRHGRAIAPGASISTSSRDDHLFRHWGLFSPFAHLEGITMLLLDCWFLLTMFKEEKEKNDLKSPQSHFTRMRMRCLCTSVRACWDLLLWRHDERYYYG